ncbi:hypothetical protein [Candidatus Protochlamydia phocaeensis]|uniref:hypothetical protein n=1 Tax=Candidatus Protochlamydia phocaeensis TaxID=1414722 RepID=UPI0012AB8DA9|nr:hypothetical protein [Candidatus Protochlamydia phocaeensis]
MHVICLLFFAAAAATEDMAQKGQQAQAFAQANDLNQASLMYEDILKQPMPDWQQAIVLYNLGTIKILQQQWENALQYFHRMPLNAVSFPLLIRYLYQNEGAAYLGRAWSLAARSPDQDLDQQLDFAIQSLRKFKEAAEMDCRMQRLEEERETLNCQPSWDLAHMLAHVRSQIDEIKQQQRKQLLQNADLSASALLLSNGLEQLLAHLRPFERNKEDLHSTPYRHYFISQASTLLPLWQRADQYAFSPEQLKLKNEAEDAYKAALQALEHGNFSQAIDQFQASLAKIKALSSPSDQERLLMEYRLLLINEIGIERIQELLKQQKQLALEKKEAESLKEANAYLEESLQQLKEKREFLARFFLIAAYISLEDFLNPSSKNEAQKNNPALFLKQALQQAQQTLWLTRLFNLSEQAGQAVHDQQLSILRKRQKTVVEQAPLFIEAVLASEKEHFSNAKDRAHCQEHPWKEALPLFEEGSQAAQQAQALLSASHLDSFQAPLQQEQTVQYWRQALKILENPPSSESQQQQQQQQQQTTPSQPKQSPSSAEKTPKSMNEILRLIQEMQLQDQPQSGEKPLEEQHTW